MHIHNEPTSQKITVTVPNSILSEALEITGEGITKTVREGLEHIARSRVSKQVVGLHGSSKIEGASNLP